MKKLILFIVLLLCAGETFAASALRNGLYLNAKAGVSRTQLKGKEISVKKKGFPFALALGARVYHFRLEAEYSFMPKVKGTDFEMQSEVAMAQAYYDVPLKARIRPFLNIGLGRYATKFKQPDVSTKTQHGVAYNFGGGLTFSISKASNLDIGYRYLRLKDVKAKDEKLKPESHMIYIGWRYVF